jgi:hypothetical protein
MSAANEGLNKWVFSLGALKNSNKKTRRVSGKTWTLLYL